MLIMLIGSPLSDPWRPHMVNFWKPSGTDPLKALFLVTLWRSNYRGGDPLEGCPPRCAYYWITDPVCLSGPGVLL